MLDPSWFVAAVRVVVSPVNHPALFIPRVFPFEGDRVANLEGIYPGGDIYVVADEKGLAGSQRDDEPLVTISINIVCE
jgi:hypothetical protein